MVKCLVCGTEYEAAECPRCHFPDIQIVGDREAVLASLMPTIQAYKKSFYGNARVELVVHRWKAQNGQVVPDREERIALGTALELQDGEIWLDTKFARIPDLETVPVTICITNGDASRMLQVNVPNLHKPELQQLGACLDKDLNLRLLLKNDSQQPVQSGPVPLIPE